MDRYAAVYLAFTKGHGITHHLAQASIALCSESRQADIDVYILAPGEQRDPGIWARIDAAIPAHQIIRCAEEDLVSAIGALLDQYEMIVTHAHGNSQLLAIRRAFRDRERLRLVLQVHSFRGTAWYGGLWALCSSLLHCWAADRVLYPTPSCFRSHTGSAFVDRLGLAQIVPAGMDQPASLALSTDLKEALGTKSGPRALYLASLNPGKGHKWVIEALVPVFRAEPSFQLVLAGDGPLASHLQRRVRAAGLSHQVLFLGHVPRSMVPGVIAQCDFALVPSRTETFGSCFVEPMRQGLPVVGTRTGIGEHLIQDHLTGFQVRHGDRAAVARAARYLCANRSACESMGDRAREVASLLSWSSVAGAYLAIYSQLLSESRWDLVRETAKLG